MQGWEAKGAIMVLGGVLPLDADAESLWAAITAEFIVYEIVEVVGEMQVERVELSVALISQNPPLKETSTAVSRNHDALRHRILQEIFREQELTFDLLLLIKSVVTEHDINAYIIGAFDTYEEKREYLKYLRETGHPANANSVSVTRAASVDELDGTTVDSPPFDNVVKAQGGDGNPKARRGLTTALTVVGVVGLCLAAFFFMKGMTTTAEN